MKNFAHSSLFLIHLQIFHSNAEKNLDRNSLYPRSILDEILRGRKISKVFNFLQNLQK